MLAAHDVPGWDLVVAGPVRRRSGTAPTGAARVVVGPTAMVLGSPVTDDGLEPPRRAAVDVSVLAAEGAEWWRASDAGDRCPVRSSS